ncbi:FecR family protein [Aestuariibaculum sp. M13]|uniref:FecR family protein n=1 Tax=Aestuariibaculum sp. M13 TaxID=2967132 RepID=UPI002159DD3F|nr:FecR family protein [Aestuariibaculum sp. M13]MCR8667885.1 FecR family protein [Aestuariibaculum sp. M13]
MIEIFNISRLIIKKKLGLLSDSDENQLGQFYKENTHVDEIKIEDLIDRLEDYSQIDKEKAWGAIESKSNKSIPVYKLPIRAIYKFAAAAAIIGICALVYFKVNNTYNGSIEVPQVVTTPILPGTDKATLTLEDGSVIELDKKNPFQTNNAQSNGEKIVYQKQNGKSAKILYNYLTIPRGGQFYIVLSDGTEVWLNSESQLKYPVAFKQGTTREVELVYGEAYFDVSPSTEHGGAKFKVLNKSQEIEVIGTEFNVKAYSDEEAVFTTLVEGKVLVDNGMSSKNLLPNQQSILDKKQKSFKVEKVDVNQIISWKQGIFSFRNESLKDMMKVVSRWYDVNVVFENKDLENIKFKGILDKDQSLEEILSIINSTSINGYSIEGKTVTLK